MIVERIRRKLQRQAEQLAHIRRENPEACPNARRFTAIVGYRSGDPVPTVPAGTGIICEFCGDEHVLVIEEVVVSTREEAAAARGAR